MTGILLHTENLFLYGAKVQNLVPLVTWCPGRDQPSGYICSSISKTMIIIVKSTQGSCLDSLKLLTRLFLLNSVIRGFINWYPDSNSKAVWSPTQAILVLMLEFIAYAEFEASRLSEVFISFSYKSNLSMERMPFQNICNCLPIWTASLIRTVSSLLIPLWNPQITYVDIN
jgi:hypothetical protein